MRKLCIQLTLSTLAIFIATHSTCYAESSGHESFNTPCTLNVKNSSLDDVFNALCMQLKYNEIRIDVDSEVHSKLKKDKIVCTCRFRNIETKYVLAWLIHLAEVNATIRDDGSVYVATTSTLKESDPIFECYKETKGKWHDKLKKKLEGKAFETNMTDDSLGGYLQSFQLKYGISMIVDPSVNDDYMKAKVTVQGGTEGSCGDQLTLALKQTSLTYKLQGGVIFITK